MKRRDFIKKHSLGRNCGTFPSRPATGGGAAGSLGSSGSDPNHHAQKEPAARFKAGTLDLVSLRAHSAKHLCALPPPTRLGGSAASRSGMDRRRQPLPARGEWPTGAMGAGALRPALAGSRPDGPDISFAIRALTPWEFKCCITVRATARGRPGSADCCFGWRLKRPTAGSKRLFPTRPGTPSSRAPGSPATTNAGICAACKKSLTRAFSPTAGQRRLHTERRLAARHAPGVRSR